MITLIWQCNADTAWERDWIEFLFREIPHKTITDYSLTTQIDNSIIIYNNSVNNDDYIKNLHHNKLTFGLYHISDEWYKDSVDNYPLAKFVIRNYYGDQYAPNVRVFPVGCITGYPYELPTNTVYQRPHIWSFSGHVDKTTRPQMVQYMSTVPKGKSFFKVSGEYNGYALNPMQMWDICNNSIFVPCPKGNNSMESFRVCEALQAGALPIVERNDYWNKLYGSDHPLIQIDSWEDAPKLISDLLLDLNLLEKKRLETQQWWHNFCNNLSNQIQGLL